MKEKISWLEQVPQLPENFSGPQAPLLSATEVIML